jgi:hypothetical protein
MSGIRFPYTQPEGAPYRGDKGPMKRDIASSDIVSKTLIFHVFMYSENSY